MLNQNFDDRLSAARDLVAEVSGKRVKSEDFLAPPESEELPVDAIANPDSQEEEFDFEDIILHELHEGKSELSSTQWMVTLAGAVSGARKHLVKEKVVGANVTPSKGTQGLFKKAIKSLIGDGQKVK